MFMELRVFLYRKRFLDFAICILSIFFSINTAIAQTNHHRSFVPGIENEDELREHDHYKNKSREDTHSPTHSNTGLIPTGATAVCRDGEYSFSHTSSGTCSRHGGVDKWLR
jgi:hypothetical protein